MTKAIPEENADDVRAEAVQFAVEHPEAREQIAELEGKYGEKFWEETPVKNPSTPSSRGDEKSPAQKAKDKADHPTSPKSTKAAKPAPTTRKTGTKK